MKPIFYFLKELPVMSQKKVDYYNEQKANRKQIVKKRKRVKIFRETLLVLVLVGLVGWIGYSAYSSYEASQPREMAEVDYEPVSSYLNEL